MKYLKVLPNHHPERLKILNDISGESQSPNNSAGLDYELYGFDK